MTAVTDKSSTIFVAPKNLGARKFWDASFVFWGILATALGLGVLAALLYQLWNDALPRFWDGSSLAPTGVFFMSFPGTEAATAGILSAWVGSLLVILTTAAIAIPLGVMAAVYLEEYAPKNRITDLIEVTVNNLAGVPSIVYGLLGLGLFIYGFGMGQTILTGGLTLALLILPVIIVATREAVRAVPRGIREAALSVGATKWRATGDHVLPYATPGIVTGIIIGLSRALGETAPLIVLSIPTFVAFLPFHAPGELKEFEIGQFDAMGNAINPDFVEKLTLPMGGTVSLPDGTDVQVAAGGVIEAPTGAYVSTTYSWGEAASTWQPFGEAGWLDSSFTVMPMQMFNWTQRPEAEFLQNAAAAGIVLLFITLALNGTAIWLRYNLRKKIRW
jgi:phosphate transport system permease protein